MPTIRVERTIDAKPEKLWRVVGDPHHLPRWWPRVQRVEQVEDDAWTAVMSTEKGRIVRADYRLLAFEPGRHRSWALEVEDSPFERFFTESVTELDVEPTDDGALHVQLALRQRPRGISRMAGWLFRRAGRRQLQEALDNLESITSRR
jgi:uncharacterized protein YndB with AHSA1/START domain